MGRAFTDEFKREAVKLVEQPGAKVTHIVRDLGIEQSVLRRWTSYCRGTSLRNSPATTQHFDSPPEIASTASSMRCRPDAYRFRFGGTILEDYVALRIGAPLKWVAVAAPRYLNRTSALAEPEDLRNHNCIQIRT
jgi:hypothetical protein